MAIHASSTTAPARPLLPARDARGRFVKLAGVPKSGETPELPPRPLLPVDSIEAIRADLNTMLGRVDAFEAAGDASVEPEAVEVLARMGREMYARRALERAVEHAAAMLPAIGLPRLVGPGFKRLDPVEIGDALDAAIAALDGLDHDPDLEPDLGWTGAAFNRSDRGDTFDREDDGEEEEDAGDSEPSLASPENHGSQLNWAAGAHLDAERDDAEHDDDRSAEHSAFRVWVFGPSRREASHV